MATAPGSLHCRPLIDHSFTTTNHLFPPYDSAQVWREFFSRAPEMGCAHP
jgi:hypothetical protein